MVLNVKGLVKRYNSTLAVDHVDLSVPNGSIFGLLGPNGAGKTSLINTIIGMTSFDSGDVSVLDMNLKTNEKDIKKIIGVVPQELALYNDLTAYQNIDYFGRLYGLKGSLLKERIKEVLDFTNLWDKKNELPSKFSGGMKRRLNISCALVHHPKLVIMDEPTVGIDPQSRNHIMESVRRLNQSGTSVIYTSHYMEEVDALCTDIAIMDHGRIIAKGTKNELIDRVSVEDKIAIKVSSCSYTVTEDIGKIYGVQKVVFEDNVIHIISKSKSNNLSKIIDSIIKTGTLIEGVTMDKMTLEDVFLTLTGRTLRD